MLLLTGTALLNFAAWKKLLPDPIFPDSLLSFLLSPFGGRGIVPEISVKSMLQLLLRIGQGRAAAAMIDLVYGVADVRRRHSTPPCARDRRNLSKLQETTIAGR